MANKNIWRRSAFPMLISVLTYSRDIKQALLGVIVQRVISQYHYPMQVQIFCCLLSHTAQNVFMSNNSMVTYHLLH